MKIGIVSTSRIIDVFWEALPEMQDITVSAICCRPQSVSKARAWSEMHQIPAVYTDYDKFLAEGDYDIIYDGTVNSMHYPDALRAVQAGRSIIMEKPFTLTAKECADVIRLAQDRNVWLFEAITTLHSPCFQFMKECLPRLGPLRGGTMSFSMMPPRYAPYRQRIALSTTFDPKLGGGCLMDMNVYNLHLAIGLLGAPDCAAYYPNRRLERNRHQRTGRPAVSGIHHGVLCRQRQRRPVRNVSPGRIRLSSAAYPAQYLCQGHCRYPRRNPDI